jgi:hypothetical protein
MGSRLAFSVVQITEAYGDDGRQNLLETKVSAQKVDGSQAFQVARSFRNAAGGYDSIEFRNVFDVTLKKHFGIDPLTRSLTTRRLLEPKIAEMSSKPVCGSLPEAGVLLGYRVLKTSEERRLAANQTVTIERWVAPDLECFPLQTVVRKFDRGTSLAQTTSRVLSANIGNPDPTLFVIPSDYVERSPSAVMTEHVKIGKTNFDSKLAQLADRSYYDNQ